MAIPNAQERRGWGTRAQCFLSAWLVVFAVSTASLARTAAEAVPRHEFEVKGAFLFNFAQFVDWPAEAFASVNAPLVIGILGADPFGPFLDEVLRKETVNGRPVVVERYRWVGEIDRCHVLFVSGSEGSRAEHILRALRGQPILTVCDTEVFARHGAMIHLVRDRQHVRLRINLEVARRSGLVISSKLLRTAEIVTGGRSRR